MRYGLILGAIGVAVGLFMLATVSVHHGVYALIVLPLCALALATWGGPQHLARRLVVRSEGLRIERFHRVRTLIEWAELEATATRMQPNAKGRSQAILVLDPVDPEVFFSRHRELREVRQGDSAVVPIGRSADTVAELTEALDRV